MSNVFPSTLSFFIVDFQDYSNILQDYSKRPTDTPLGILDHPQKYCLFFGVFLVFHLFFVSCYLMGRSTFVIGYIADYIIYWINIFPKLDLYYEEVGIGLWGGFAILFSVLLSLGINKFK